MRSASTGSEILLINYGLVDSWTTSMPFFYVPYYPNNVVRRWCRKILRLFKRGLRAPWIRRIIPCGQVVSPVEFRQNLSQIIHRSRALNPATQILIWSTVLVHDQPLRNESIQQYNAILRDVAHELNCQFLDVSTALDSNDYHDAVHINGDGALRVARAMLRCLDMGQIAKGVESSAA